MSPSIQTTLPIFRERQARSISLPNLSPYLIGADDQFYYGTRGTASRLTVLCLLAHIRREPSVKLTSVEVNMAGCFRSAQLPSSDAGFTETEFFYTEQARSHERLTASQEWRALVGRRADELGTHLRDEGTNWTEATSFMVEHPEGGPMMFKQFPRLKILGLPMRTIFGAIVNVTMFSKSDAATLIRWVDVPTETVDVTLKTTEGIVTLAKRETVDPRYRRLAP